MKKLAIAAALALAVILGTAACANEEVTTPVGEPAPDPGYPGGIPPMPEFRNREWDAPADIHNPDDLPLIQGEVAYLLQNPAVMLQLQPLVPGEELAILHTNMGDITLRLFPDEAPIAVANFRALARAGHYDGLIFHRVIPDFMIQGGCFEGTGRGGESIWGETFSTEISHNLRHFRGAVAMAHAGPGTIGSQFYIVQNQDVGSHFAQGFEEMMLPSVQNEPMGLLPDGTRIYMRDVHPVEGLQYFLDNGGTPSLDWFWNMQGAPHPVFAHVVSGMDVVDAIANTSRNHDDRPLSDMIIESISFIIYQ